MKTDIIIYLTVALLFTTTTACNEDDETNMTGDDATSDVGDDTTDDTSVPDTSTPDAGDTLDTSDTTADAQPDSDVSTGDTTNDASEPSCSDEEYATAVNDALSPQTVAVSSDLVTLTSDGDVNEATIEAGLGGIANAPSSSWVYLDLDAPAQVVIGDVEALDDADWDLAFKRTSIRLNSGDSGPGPWMVTTLTETTWEEAQVPGRDSGAEYATDDFVDNGTCAILAGERTGIETAFGQWYSYDMSAHTVRAPENTIFVLYNSTTHQTRRLEIQSYEDGTYELRWAPFPTAGE